MKAETETLTVRVPKAVVAKLKKEARERRMSKSDVVRERLAAPRADASPDPLADIRDLIGSVKDDLPTDLAARKKHYLKEWGFGRKRHR